MAEVHSFIDKTKCLPDEDSSSSGSSSDSESESDSDDTNKVVLCENCAPPKATG